MMIGCWEDLVCLVMISSFLFFFVEVVFLEGAGGWGCILKKWILCFEFSIILYLIEGILGLIR